jgi:hypothetical protein
MDERVFNPSRETRLILRQAGEIGEHASRLCELLFAIEGRVGQRKLWGIVGLMRRYPAHCINAACAQALEQGVYSYKRVLALTEALFAQAMAAIEAHATHEHSGADNTPALTQQHELIRDPEEYGDLFAHAAGSKKEFRDQLRHPAACNHHVAPVSKTPKPGCRAIGQHRVNRCHVVHHVAVEERP